MEIMQEVLRKGPQLICGFDKPLQHGSRVDLEHPRRASNTQAFGQARDHVHDELDRYPLAIKDGATMLGEVAVAGGTVELTPWTTVRMPVGTEIPQPQPTPVVTGGMGAEMPGGIDLTRPPVGWGHWSRTQRRRWGGM